MDWKWLLTSFDGRIDRGKFWAGLAVLIAAQVVFYTIVRTVFGSVYLDRGTLLILSSLMTLLAGFGLGYCALAVCVKRWHDLDRSHWWLLILLIPYIGGTWLLVECGCMGSKGPNRFGPSPLAGAS